MVEIIGEGAKEMSALASDSVGGERIVRGVPGLDCFSGERDRARSIGC